MSPDAILRELSTKSSSKLYNYYENNEFIDLSEASLNLKLEEHRNLVDTYWILKEFGINFKTLKQADNFNKYLLFDGEYFIRLSSEYNIYEVYQGSSTERCKIASEDRRPEMTVRVIEIFTTVAIVLFMLVALSGMVMDMIKFVNTSSSIETHYEETITKGGSE